MKRALFLIVTTVILSFFQTRNAKAQSIEDFIIWEADSNRIEQFCVHPNGNIIASQSGIAYEIDGQTGKILRFIPQPLVGYVEISNDGRLIALSSGNFTNIIDYESFSFLRKVTGQRVKFFPDNNSILAKREEYGYLDSSLSIINIETGESRYFSMKAPGPGDFFISSIGISSNGSHFASGSWLRKHQSNEHIQYFHLWDTETITPKLISMDDQQEGEVYEIHFSKDDKYLGFTRNVGGIRGAKFYSLEPGTFKTTLMREYAAWDNIKSFCFIGEGNTVVTTYRSGNNRSTKIIDILTGQIFFDDIDFYGGTIRYNEKYNTIILRGRSFVCLDLQSLLATDIEEQEPNTFVLTYQENQITIKLKETMSIINEISIIDMVGNVLYQSNNLLIRDKIQIELPLPAGVYIAKLKIGSDNYTSKFAVTR